MLFDKIRKGIGGTLVVIVSIVGSILCAVIHIWTIIIAYAISGLIGALISLWFPFFAQIYWFFRMWSLTGTIKNNYCLAILVIIGIGIIGVIGFHLISYSSKEQDRID